MRYKKACFVTTVWVGMALSASAGTFGTVVAIGGQASDIALDQGRGLLYIANFTASQIEVMSTTDYSIRTSINVAAQPAALALSPDDQYLLVAHYANYTAPQTPQNLITLINLNGYVLQTFTTGSAPLGAAFIMAPGSTLGYLGVIATTTDLLLFDPSAGTLQEAVSFASVGQQLPTGLATFPSQVVQAQLTSTPDYMYVYGVAAGATGGQGFFRCTGPSGSGFPPGNFAALNVTSSPQPLPRISAAPDGSWAMVGSYKWVASVPGFDLAQYPNATQATNIGGNVIDSNDQYIYAQILTSQPSTASGTPTPPPAASAPSAAPPVLLQLDSDNLTLEQQLAIPENIVGRMVLSSDNSVLYAVSDSGVTIFPIGNLNQYHRVVASQEDVLVQGSFCNQSMITQTLTLSDPGGGNTDFAISTGGINGVTISPSSGTTPATVQISVNPSVFLSQNGTIAVPLTISSVSAINLPPPVRLLINNSTPYQRGTIVDIPGTLTDIMADPIRSRFYVVRQDKNLVLVFDSTTYQQIAALRTSTTPTQMAITYDQNYLLVGHQNSQRAFVWDLDTLEEQPPILFPSGHYPVSLAASANAVLAVAQNSAGGPPGVIDQVNVSGASATQLPSLGVFTNSINPEAVLGAAPNGATVLVASPDGNVLLYNASANTFTASRHDFTSLQGAYAASSYNSYIVGNNILDSSLVPTGSLSSSYGSPTGFSFVNQWGFRTTQTAPASPGMIQQITFSTSDGIVPTPMVEAPLNTSTTQPFLRTLAPLPDGSAVISLSISGITVLPWNYAAATAPPQISGVLSAADYTPAVAPGGLVSVFGSQMSPLTMAYQQVPLSTMLAQSCVTVNGVPIPLLFVSQGQINAQLPLNAVGDATMTVITPGGLSESFNFSVQPAAPSIFQSGTAGPETGLATVYRTENNQLVTDSNPIHPGDTIIIYATGLGTTTPPVAPGMPAPVNPLASAAIPPSVTLGGAALNILYAGLSPGAVGVYQINASVPADLPTGIQIPLVVSQGSASTSLTVRVVN
jgi:uncharacterized protein (TIGR03437 family)